MKVNFMIMCDYASRLDNGSPILSGIFRGINVKELPGLLAPFWLALEIEADPHEAGEHRFELAFVDDDGQKIFDDELIGFFNRRPDFQPTYLYCASLVQVRRPIERKGTYRFDLSWNNSVIAQVRLDIA